MGKQLDIYKRFKANNPDKYYLFKGGIFYYFFYKIFFFSIPFEVRSPDRSWQPSWKESIRQVM